MSLIHAYGMVLVILLPVTEYQFSPGKWIVTASCYGNVSTYLLHTKPNGKGTLLFPTGRQREIDWHYHTIDKKLTIEYKSDGGASMYMEWKLESSPPCKGEWGEFGLEFTKYLE